MVLYGTFIPVEALRVDILGLRSKEANDLNEFFIFLKALKLQARIKLVLHSETFYTLFKFFFIVWLNAANLS